MAKSYPYLFNNLPDISTLLPAASPKSATQVTIFYLFITLPTTTITLTAASPLNSKVIKEMLHLSGLLMEAFPDLAKGNHADLLMRIYLDQLKTHMASNHHSKIVVIIGCFQGLEAFLTASPQACNPLVPSGKPGGYGNEVYRYMKMAFSPKSVENQTRFEPCWRALDVFTKHTKLFRPKFPTDYKLVDLQ